MRRGWAVEEALRDREGGQVASVTGPAPSDSPLKEIRTLADFWVAFPQHYADEPTVVGCDLLNEPSRNQRFSNLSPSGCRYKAVRTHRRVREVPKPLLTACGALVTEDGDATQAWPGKNAEVVDVQPSNQTPNAVRS